MSALANLVPAAMVGTDKHRISLPELPGELGQVAAAVAAATTDETERLLNVLAVVAAARQAGLRGAAAPAQLPEAAPDETLPAVEDAAQVNLLARVFEGGPLRLQLRTCRAVAASTRRLPPRLLPAALDAGHRSRDLRAPLVACMGARGRWLARLSDTWSFATGAAVDAPAEQRWAEGSLEQRRDLLREQRLADPAVARGWLQTGFADLPARERAELLAALVHGLGAADEDLIASLLADRSREVRQCAAGLLSALPDSGLARRAAERMAALLKQERAMLRKTWTLDPPAAFDPAWKADALEAAKPAGETLGERAWWLHQLARQTPLSWWTQHLGLSPGELLKWAREGHWGDALIRAWREALQVARTPEWCEALLADWPAKVLREEPSAVLALLPLPAREKHWAQMLTGGWLGRAQPLNDVAQSILQACPLGETVSPALSLKLVEKMAEELRAQNLQFDWRLRDVLPDLAVALHPQALSRLKALPRPVDAPPAQTETCVRIAQVVEIREAFDF